MSVLGEIRCDFIVFGVVKKMNKNSPLDGVPGERRKRQRFVARRWGSLDDFGGMAVYLASNASAYTTGEQFVIDGGYTKF